MFQTLQQMVITFYGEGCFKLQSGDFTVLIDPFDAKTGLTPPRFKADAILKTLVPASQSSVSNSDSLAADSTAKQFIINTPGEYNIMDLSVTGFFLANESSDKLVKTVYLTEMEEIKLCFLGHLSEMPEATILEHLEEIDILFIPAGGAPFIDQKSAMKLVKKLEPKIVIPCFFKIPSLKRTADKIDAFLEEFGQKGKQAEALEKLAIKKKDLVNINKTEITVLKI